MRKVLFFSIALVFASGATMTLTAQTAKRRPTGAGRTYPPVMKPKAIPKPPRPLPTPTPTPTPKP